MVIISTYPESVLGRQKLFFKSMSKLPTHLKALNGWVEVTKNSGWDSSHLHMTHII